VATDSPSPHARLRLLAQTPEGRRIIARVLDLAAPSLNAVQVAKYRESLAAAPDDWQTHFEVVGDALNDIAFAVSRTIPPISTSGFGSDWYAARMEREAAVHVPLHDLLDRACAPIEETPCPQLP
jgi:hypothetical protein